MYNPSYEPETDFTPTEAITADVAREKAKTYEKLVRKPEFDIKNEQDRHNWECLNYYNHIILKANIKK